MSDEVLDLLEGTAVKSGVNPNNVGNLRPVGQSTGFQQPKTAEEGISALDQNLQAYHKKGINTLAGVISRWSPPNENDTPTLIKNAAQRLNLDPNQPIDLSDPVQRHLIGSAIMLQEKGSKNLFGAKQVTPQTATQAAPEETGDETLDLLQGKFTEAEKPKEKTALDKFVEPLKDISIEDWKKHSLLAPYLAYRQNPNEKTAKGLADKAGEIAGGIVHFAQHPVESAKAIAESLMSNPFGAAAEAVKGILYDPEQLLLGGAGGAAEKAATSGIEKVATAARELHPTEITDIQKTFEKKAPTLQEQFETKRAGGSAGAQGVGAETLRKAQAQDLPIPIDLSKDQITRNPADVRFARETAKDPVLGQELQEHYAKQNDLIQKNLDHLIEQTGAEMTGVGPGEMGKKLVDIIQPEIVRRKTAINNAYAAARQAGEMNQPIDISPLKNYAESHQAEAINAPVIKSLEVKINNLAKEGNEIPLNDLEEVRKMVGNLSQDSPTNAKYARDINKLIDSLTANKGGDLYKTARKLTQNFKNEFEDTPVINNITAMKKGTTQRAVAMEDLIDKSLNRGSLDDVQKLFGTLQKIGPEGQDMIRELRGNIAQRIKDEATKNVQLDINGKPYVSTPALNKIVKDLDKSGKLDYIFGKKNAEHYRTLNDVTKNIQTVPQGTTNPSGSASSILAALGEMGAQTALTGVPIPVAMIGKHIYGKVQTGKKLTKIRDFINYGKK